MCYVFKDTKAIRISTDIPRSDTSCLLTLCVLYYLVNNLRTVSVVKCGRGSVSGKPYSTWIQIVYKTGYKRIVSVFIATALGHPLLWSRRLCTGCHLQAEYWRVDALSRPGVDTRSPFWKTKQTGTLTINFHPLLSKSWLICLLGWLSGESRTTWGCSATWLYRGRTIGMGYSPKGREGRGSGALFWKSF